MADTNTKMGLSPRLAMALSLVGDCTVLADIGTDHARLPIAAIQHNITVRAIACDVAPGPLAAAALNVYKTDLYDRIALRLGDGFDPLSAGEVDAAVIAGMGGMNIINILERGDAVAQACTRLVLQPQRDIPNLRKALHRMGYDITDERLAQEGKRYYVILAAVPSAQSIASFTWAAREYHIGKHLRNDPLWDGYAQSEIARMQKYIAQGASGDKLDDYSQRVLWLREV